MNIEQFKEKVATLRTLSFEYALSATNDAKDLVIEAQIELHLLFESQQAEITRLTALVESYKGDAERYRFIKDNEHIQSIIYHRLDSHEIDSYVDTEMKGKG